MLAIFLLVGCAGTYDILPPSAVQPASSNARERTVYVVSNGLPTTLILLRGDIAARQIPEIVDFPDAWYLEFSWGDAEYFPADKETLANVLRAAFLPTAAVLHVVPMGNTPINHYSSAEIGRISHSEAGFSRLTHFLGAGFERGSA